MKRLFRGWSWEHWYNLAREDIQEAFNSVRRAAMIAAYAGLALWVLSGFHAIRQNEVGVETILGQPTRSVEQPGLRYRLPWPLGAVHRVPVQTQQTVLVGLDPRGLSREERLSLAQQGVLDTNVARQFDNTDETEDSLLSDVMEEGQIDQTGEGMQTPDDKGVRLITADNNVIVVQAVVQYRIMDPLAYIYRTEGAELILNRAARSALLHVAADTPVDELLTTGKGEAQSQARTLLMRQIAAEDANPGVRVDSIELMAVKPPQAVAAAFRQVNTAREEMQTRINEAQQYAGTTTERARGEASRIVNEAEAFASNRVAETKGEIDRFNAVLQEYQATGRITADRLRFETLEKILNAATTVPVAPNAELDLIVPAPGQ